jgi:hypothetical protein
MSWSPAMFPTWLAESLRLVWQNSMRSWQIGEAAQGALPKAPYVFLLELAIANPIQN